MTVPMQTLIRREARTLNTARSPGRLDVKPLHALIAAKEILDGCRCVLITLVDDALSKFSSISDGKLLGWIL